MVLTNGVTHLRARDSARWQRLGQPAPTRGFPPFNPDQNGETIELVFETAADRGKIELPSEM